MSAIPKAIQIEKAKKEQELRAAAQIGAIDTVNKLISEKVDVNSQGTGTSTIKKTLRTALHWAAKNKHLEVVIALLGAGADQSIKDADGHTALWLASQEKENDAVINELQKQLLLDTKVNREQLNAITTYSFSKDVKKENQRSIGIRNIRKQLDLVAKREIGKYLLEYQKLVIDNREEIGKVIFNSDWSTLKATKEESEILDKIINETLDMSPFFNRHYLFVERILDSALEFGIEEIFVEKIRLNRVLPLHIEKIKKDIEKYFKKDLRKQIIKRLSKFLSIMKEDLQHFGLTYQTYFNVLAIDSATLCHFIDKYFPGEKINFITSLTSFFGNLGPIKIDDDAIISGFNENKKNISKCLNSYLNDLKLEFTKLGIEKKEAIIQLELLTKQSEVSSTNPVGLFYEPFIADLLKSLEEDIEKYNLEEATTGLARDVFILCHHGFGLLKGVKELLENVNILSIERFKLCSAELKTNHKRYLESMSAPSGGFEAIRMKEKTTLKNQEEERRRINKEAENKKNELMLFKKKLEEKEIREKVEKELWVKKIMDKINIKDSKMLGLIARILDKTEVQVSQIDFLSLISTLEIPGFKKTTSAAGNVTDNKLTLSLGVFYSFTYHAIHGKDGLTEVDKFSVAHLKKMLESIGINKENFWRLVKQHGIKENPVNRK